jgi:hypothetical protein
MTSSTSLPVTRAADLAEVPTARRWLVEQLWGDEAVGIIGGEPKCCKSFLALDLAVAVTSGAPCVRRFPVVRTGRVLLFAAEDALHVVRQRLAGIARAAGRDLADLDIHVITAPSVRLDVERDRDALSTRAPAQLSRRRRARAPRAQGWREDARRAGPARLERIPRLGRLEPLLRRHVEHQLTLSVEHRAAASISTVSLHLDTADDAVALTAIDRAPAALVTAAPAEVTIDQRILAELEVADAPLSATALRKRCQIRNATLQAALAALVADGRLRRDRAGYALAR